MVEQVGNRPQLRVLGNLNHEVGNPRSDGNGLLQNLEGQYEKDRIMLQKTTENYEFSILSVQQGVRITSGIQSAYGVLLGNFPQSSHDNIVQPVPNSTTQYQVKQDIPIVGGMALQPSDHLVDESPKDYSSNIPAPVPVEDNMKSYATYDHLRQVDEKMENLRVSAPEMLTINEQNKSPTDNLKGEDILENRSHHVGGESYPNDSSYVHNLRAA